jgi:mannose-1-phosphate guanylyltransferase/mannose-6-phosphate isomerase-like protein (cupin superfamily)
MPESILPICLVGGAGTRLAPLSTPDRPKPFLSLPSGGSLLQQTLRRLAPYRAPVLVGQAPHRFMLQNHARDAGVTPRALLLEPVARNTAMAVALAVAQQLAEGQGSQLLAILPADHAIADEAAWHHALAQAAAIAQQHDSVVLTGMRDASPSPELGYMQLAGEQVVAFREKPAHAAALAREGWLANSGQFVARAGVVAHLFAQHAPLLWDAAQRAIAQALRVEESLYAAPAAYDTVLPVPFDRAVIEKAAGLRAVTAACGWRDIGTMAAFCAHACLPVGATLPYPRSDHPWGYAEHIAGRPGSLAKCLTLYPGQRLSLQRHHRRVEVWLVLEGEALVMLDGQYISLMPGQSLSIPRLSWHRLLNAGEGVLRVMELQLGACDEADIERAADDYGRA